MVRAKVDCVRFTQGRSDACLHASQHLALALNHLRVGAVRVALIGGAPGTGKTTLAHTLAERVGAQVISTDEVRRELQQANVICGATGILEAGLYAYDKVSTVYAEVIRRAHIQLAGGHSVILDATLRDPRLRDLARQLAIQTDSAMLELVCTTPVKSAAERVRARSQGNSDATAQIAEELAAKGDRWENAHHIDTRNPVSQCSDEAEKLWRDTW